MSRATELSIVALTGILAMLGTGFHGAYHITQARNSEHAALQREYDALTTVSLQQRQINALSQELGDCLSREREYCKPILTQEDRHVPDVWECFSTSLPEVAVYPVRRGQQDNAVEVMR